MGGFEPVLEVALLALLAVTLVHAVRLQRALLALQKDRARLDVAVAGFDGGIRHAEAGLGRMRDAAQQLGSGLGAAEALRDDLSFLTERGGQVADRLDALVRAARSHDAGHPGGQVGASGAVGQPAVRSQAERNLLLALQVPR